MSEGVETTVGQPKVNGPLGMQVLEQYSVALICTASGLYIIRCLPSILFPQGALMTALILLLGMAVGIAAFIAAMVFAFYALTQPATGVRLPAVGLASTQDLHRATSPPAARVGTRTVTGPSDVPPHAFCKQGELNGVVYTIQLSRFGREDIVREWPPTTAGLHAFARKWKASVSQGTLVLTPLVECQPLAPGVAAAAAEPKHQSVAAALDEMTGSDEAIESAAAHDHEGNASDEGAEAATNATLNKVGIPLEGCTVEVVTEGLKGRSEWIRRAPLLVSHPKWNLLDGERGFYLLADDPASKQQWYHALSWWCERGEERARTIEALYAAYCHFMARQSALEYPQEESTVGVLDPPDGNSNNGSGSDVGTGPTLDNHAAATAGRRNWKTWGAQKMQVVKKRVQERRRGARAVPEVPALPVDAAPHIMPPLQPPPSASSLPGLPPASPVATSSSQEPEEPQLANLESLIDARWMQSTKIPMPPTIPKAISRPVSPSRVLRPTSSEQATSAKDDYLAGLGAGFATPPMGTSPQRHYPLAAASPASKARLSPAKLQQQGFSGDLPKGEEATTVGSRGTTGLQLPSSMPGTPLRSASRGVPEKLGAAGVEGSASRTPRVGAGEQQELLAPPIDPFVLAAVQQQQQATGATAAAAGTVGPGPEGDQHDGDKSATTAAAPAQKVDAAQAAGVGLPPGMPPLLAGDYAVNMLLTRAGFDLLRSPAVHETVKQRIQRRLALLNTPEYVQSLEVVDVSLGTTVPSVRNFASLPTPGESIWPQMVFDLYYQGSFTITLETKVDIRDAAAWGRFDRALCKLEGRVAGDGSSPRAMGLGASGEEAASLHQIASGEVYSGGNAMAASSPELSSMSPCATDAGDEDLVTGGEEEALLAVEHSAELAPSFDGGNSGGEGGAPGRRGQFMSKLRATAGRKLRQLAETTATRINKMSLRVSLTFSVLEGTMMAWVPPPPGNRLFISFLRPPRLVVQAKPEVGGRLLKYSYAIARVSSWIEMRMRAALTKNMVFPGGSDFVLAGLMDLDNPSVAKPLPGLAYHIPSVAVGRTGVGVQSSKQKRRIQWQQQQEEEEKNKALANEDFGKEMSVSGTGPKGPAHCRSAPQLAPAAPDHEATVSASGQQLASLMGARAPELIGAAVPLARPITAPVAVPSRTAAAVEGSEGGAAAVASASTAGVSASWPGQRSAIKPALTSLGRAELSSSVDGRPTPIKRRVTKSVSFPDPELSREDPPQEQRQVLTIGGLVAGVPAGPIGEGSPAGSKAEGTAEPSMAAVKNVGGDAASPVSSALDHDLQRAAAPGATGGVEEVAWSDFEGASPQEEETWPAHQEAGGDMTPAAASYLPLEDVERASIAVPESGHVVAKLAGSGGSAGVEPVGHDALQASQATSSLATGSQQPGGSQKLMSKGLQYLRQHKQHAQHAQQGGLVASRDPVDTANGGDVREEIQSQSQQLQGGAGGIKAQSRRVAGLMLSRMNQAGKALAQHVQQARTAQQQSQQGGKWSSATSGASSIHRQHSD